MESLSLIAKAGVGTWDPTQLKLGTGRIGTAFLTWVTYPSHITQCPERQAQLVWSGGEGRQVLRLGATIQLFPEGKAKALVDCARNGQP